MNRDVPGVLSLSAYAALAVLHRPDDPQQLAAEIRRLHGTGLRPRDVAVALRLDLGQVLAAIAVPERAA